LFERTAVVLLLAVAPLVGATAVFAQIELAVLQGIVRDEAGQPLEGVTVRVRDQERGAETTAQSGRDGRFYRRGLRAGGYQLTVEKQGYQPINDKVTLSAGVDRRLEFKLVKAAPEGAEEFAKGVEAFNRKDYQGAVQSFEAAIQKAPTLPEIHVNLALAYLRLNRNSDAVAALEKAAALSQNDPHVLFQLGGAYVEFKQLDRAAVALEKGLAQSAGLSDPLAFEATVTLGAVYFAQGDNDKAIAQFEKALAARPDAATPKLGLGKAYFSKNDVPNALRYFKEVVASAPGSPEAAEATAFIQELEKARSPAA
jgi:tetratricopeptide (TPR) repeat protein